MLAYALILLLVAGVVGTVVVLVARAREERRHNMGNHRGERRVLGFRRRG